MAEDHSQSGPISEMNLFDARVVEQVNCFLLRAKNKGVRHETENVVAACLVLQNIYVRKFVVDKILLNINR